MNHILILTAMESELKPLRKALKLKRTNLTPPYEYTGEYKNLRITAGITNMGMDSAQKYSKIIISKSKPDLVIFSGIADAYDNNLKIGELITTSSVMDHRDEKKYPVNNFNLAEHNGLLLSTDKITYEEEYTSYLDKNNVIAIDMEAGAIASVCNHYGIPLSVCKAISDRVEVDKISYEIFNLANQDGSANLRAVSIYLIAKPWRIFHLIKVGIGTYLAIKKSTKRVIKIINLNSQTQSYK